MLERVWLIKDWEFIERLSRDELRRLENKSRAKSFAATSAFQFPADSSSTVFLLSQGRARCVIGSDARGQRLIEEIDPGDLFGPCVSGIWSPMQSGIEFLKNATVIAVPRDVIEKVLRQRRGMSRFLRKNAGGRRECLERPLADQLFKSSGRRVCHLVAEIGRRLGRRTAKAIEVQCRVTDREIATIAGSTMELVRATLDELHSLHIIERHHHDLTILDEGRLVNWVHQEMREPNKTNASVRVVR